MLSCYRNERVQLKKKSLKIFRDKKKKMVLKMCASFLLLIVVEIWRVGANFSNTSDAVLKHLDVMPRMEWLGRLFDHNVWQIEYTPNVSHVCDEHIAVYLRELKSDSPWAAKMYDASGRYNGQYFFGNEFWLGSNTLCWELSNIETNPQVPPFPVHFSVAKVQLVLGGPDSGSGARQLMIGFCLPSSCSALNVKSLLEMEANRTLSNVVNASIEILDVRPVPGDYDLLKDIKFYIVGGFAVGVFFLVIIATAFELWIRHRNHQTSDNELQVQTNNNNELKNVNISIIVPDKQRKKDYGEKGVLWRVMLCFSALSNGEKILEVDRLPQGSINCVHGLRFLSVTWVILVHTYLQVFSIAENKTVRVITERFFIYQTVSNATFSVDSFFFISGLLVTILYFRTSRKKQSVDNERTRPVTILDDVKKFLLLVFYRLVRLTPAYLFVLGIHEIVIRFIHNNSVFEPNFYDHVTCDNYWWRNALYINIWYPQKEICMLWSWYMSNDTQFYIIAVIILLIGVRSDRHLKVAASLVFGCLFTSWVSTFLIAYRYEYHARIEEPFALFDQLYDKPWMRCGPYLVGMVTGWLLYRLDCKMRMHWFLVTSAWTASILCLLSLVYGLGKDGLQVPLSAFYAALGHTAWGLALAWITFACCTGYGGFIEKLLSFRGFLPFSRLTYCAYLVHPMLMCLVSFQMDGPLHLHNGMVLIIFFGNMVLSFLVSFLISLGFEAPVVRLLKIIMGGRNKED